ncbi:MAG: hemolysin family protein [Verrucomicrobiae bacterium]|nr:hemolysin family protein [Verrucomicrobiae bacterium]
MEELIILGFKIGIILLLVFLNGFFVAAEFALVKIRGSQLDELINEGNRRAKFARHLVDHLDAYLSSTQLGITMTSLALGWVGEPFLAHKLEPFFESLGVFPHGTVTVLLWQVQGEHMIKTVSFIIAFSIITFLHIVFGELAPKSLAIQKPRGVTLWVAYPLHGFYIVFKPFINFLNGTANMFLRSVGIQPAREGELVHSAEELMIILDESTKGQQLTNLSKDLAMRAIELQERVVRDVMIPRNRVAFLSTHKSLDENVRLAKAAEHSRFPLVAETIDQVEGLILFKELIILRDDKGREGDIRGIRREIDFVPEMMPLEKLLARFQVRKSHLAVVVDEFGATVGIVSLEDVLEELVGDIQDEFDQEEPTIRHITEDEFVIEGITPLHDFEEMTGVTFETEEVSTVGGYITMQLGHLPHSGEQARIGPYLCTVRKSDGRKVLSAHFKKEPGPAPDRPSGEKEKFP